MSDEAITPERAAALLSALRSVHHEYTPLPDDVLASWLRGQSTQSASVGTDGVHDAAPAAAPGDRLPGTSQDVGDGSVGLSTLGCVAADTSNPGNGSPGSSQE